MAQLTNLAAEALKASVLFSAEVVSISQFNLPLSTLNRTATITGMRDKLAAMLRFVDALESAARD